MSRTASVESLGQKSKPRIVSLGAQARGLALDGILMRSPKPYQKQTAKNARQSQPKIHPNAQPSQAIHSRLVQSLTLMRQAVPTPKPLPNLAQDIKRRLTSTKDAAPSSLTPKITRALSVKKHSKVSRFGQSVASGSKAVLAEVRPSLNQLSSRISNNSNKPSAPGSVVSAIARPMPTAMPSLSHQKLERMLDKALASADAHKKALSNSRRSFWGRFGKSKWLGLILSFILLASTGVVLAYSRVPSFAVRVASLRAGVDAQAPSYVPANFSLSSTSFSKGNVALQFKNGTAAFTLTQQKSPLNSESLQASFASAKNKFYQTAQYNGVAVYTYSNASQTSPNATWINKGVQTTLTNSANLSSEQVNKLVQSMLR